MENKMILSAPQIMFGQVMHKRFFPKVNAFKYGIYYLSLPLSKLNKDIENSYFKLNRFGPLSFYNKDHGYRDGSDLRQWARDMLDKFNIVNVDGEIVLISMPRVLGYVFNPVSFWLCHDKDNKIRAIICEVNNTFGQTHSYVCAHDSQDEITGDDFLDTDKVFHVSPFIQREGGYKFRFSFPKSKMGAWIDHFDKEEKLLLATSLTGNFTKIDKKACKKAFWRYPLVTIKAILLIHWQAVKLFVKGTEYVPKPLQYENKVTLAKTLK